MVAPFKINGLKDNFDRKHVNKRDDYFSNEDLLLLKKKKV